MLAFLKRKQSSHGLGKGVPYTILPGPDVLSQDFAMRGVIDPLTGPAGVETWYGPPGVNKAQLLTLQGPMLFLAPIQVPIGFQYVAGFKGSIAQKSAGPVGQPAPNAAYVDSAAFINLYNE